MWAWLRWVGKLKPAARAIGRVVAKYGPTVVGAVIEGKATRREAEAAKPPR